MLTVKNTPNEAGLEISGDHQDLDSLYLALHTVVGEEGEFGHYDGARLRVLGICYDLRHAFMGDREVEFVDNGMDESKMRFMGLITPDKNIHYKFNVYYPEVLFVITALNDFVHLYTKKRTKNAIFPLLDKRNLWDSSIANVRLFQSEVINCVKNTVTEASFKRMMNLMHHEFPWVGAYATQYIDLLNIRYLDMDKEERKKSLPTIVKRFIEQGREYRDIELNVREAAMRHGCSTEDIALSMDYPEEVDW